MSKPHRIFIAIPLHQGIQQVVRGLQQELKKTAADVKWVNPEQIHLTLKFLGDVETEKIVSIIKAMQNLASLFAFETEVTQSGAFPSFHLPQILCIGLGDPEGTIQKIVEII